MTGEILPNNKDSFGDGGGNTGLTSTFESGPRPAGIGIASGGGGGASSRQGGTVVKAGTRPKGKENDRIAASGGSIFYQVSYNIYG